MLEITARLCDLPLEEIAGVGRGLVAALERSVDEAVGNAVRNHRRQLRRGRIITELDQRPLVGGNDLQALRDCGRCTLQALRSVGVLSDDGGIICEIELLRRPFRDAVAGEKTHLGRNEVVGVDIRSVALARLFVRHRNRRRVGFQSDPCAIDRRGQQGHENGADETQRYAAEH